jgi:LPXTG-site transpeptidase (sortase) family protein
MTSNVASNSITKNTRNISLLVFLIGALLLFSQTLPFNNSIPVQSISSDNLFIPKPTEIKISALNIDAPVTNLGLNSDGTLAVPKKDGDVGWYTGSEAPGGTGPTVMVGHLDSIRGAAVFINLKKIKAGDEISINREDGSSVIYKVDRMETYSQNNFPTNAVYGAINYAGIRLITCSGTFSRLSGHYSDNLVVYGSLVKISKS